MWDGVNRQPSRVLAHANPLSVMRLFRDSLVPTMTQHDEDSVGDPVILHLMCDWNMDH